MWAPSSRRGVHFAENAAPPNLLNNLAEAYIDSLWKQDQRETSASPTRCASGGRHWLTGRRAKVFTDERARGSCAASGAQNRTLHVDRDRRQERRSAIDGNQVGEPSTGIPVHRTRRRPISLSRVLAPSR